MYDFPMLEMGDLLGINTDLRIYSNSIPHTEMSTLSDWLFFQKVRLINCDKLLYL